MLLPVVLTLIAAQDTDTVFVKHLGNLCYTKWALEAFVIANAERFVVTMFLLPSPLLLHVMDSHSLRYELGNLVHAQTIMQNWILLPGNLLKTSLRHFIWNNSISEYFIWDTMLRISI